MIAQHVVPSGIEQTFGVDEVIVSKTDTKGRITYTNRIFLRISGYHEPEVLGQPHSLIRHSDISRGVFRLLWQSISAGREVFAYVINRSIATTGSRPKSARNGWRTTSAR